MATKQPAWLNPPVEEWIHCSVEGLVEPDEYAVQLDINGQEVAAFVPRNTVKVTSPLPSKGRVRVFIVAHLSGDSVLADLPTAPLNGTQRINVSASLFH